MDQEKGCSCLFIQQTSGCFSENNPGADHLNDNTILKAF